MIDRTLQAQAVPLGLRVEAQGAGSATRHVYRGSARLFSGRPGQIEDYLSGYHDLRHHRGRGEGPLVNGEAAV